MIQKPFKSERKCIIYKGFHIKSTVKIWMILFPQKLKPYLKKCHKNEKTIFLRSSTFPRNLNSLCKLYIKSKQRLQCHLALGVIVTHCPHWCLKICCCLLLNLVGQMMNFKSVEPWNKLICGTLWPIFWMHHKKHVRKTSAKICPISVMVSWGLRSVDIHAFRAV